MSNIVSLRNDLIVKLPETQQKYITVKNTPNYGSLTENDKKAFCLDLVQLSLVFAGSKDSTNDDMLVLHTTLIMVEISHGYTHLTTGQIKQAFELGLRNHYGQYFGLNQKTYHFFLKSYIELQDRIDAERTFSQLLEQASIKKTDKPLATKFEEDKNSTIRAFNEYKETKKLPFVAFAFYRFLWKDAKVVTWNEEEKSEIIQEAEKKYTSYLKNSKASGQISTSQYENAMADLFGNPTLNRYKQEIALKKYWDKLISNNQNLEDVLNASAKG